MIIDTLNNLCEMLSLSIFLALFGLFYYYILKTWFYFSDRKVKFVRGVPLIGTAYRSFFGLEPATISFRRCYRRYPQEKFIGLYELGGKPLYLLRDPKLIKQVTTTDFDHFVNPKPTFDTEDDVFAHTLFGMRDDEWRQMRQTMCPAFTSKRMQSMHDLMVRCCEHFLESLMETDKIAKIFDTRDLFSRYANDIIANTAFGVELNSLREPDNDFFRMGNSLAKFGYLNDLKFIANLNIPSFLKSFDFRMKRTTNAQNTMRTIIKQNIASHKNRHSENNDIIDLLIKARDGQLVYDEDREHIKDVGFASADESNVAQISATSHDWTDDDLVAQCMLFFFHGYSSISSACCFIFHELSLNPDIQTKLYNEMQSVRAELHGSRLTYEMIPKLKYLDMVVTEGLRRWSPIPYLKRTCNRPYTLENHDGSQVHLNVYDEVLIPIYALHHDPQYYPNPEKFNPERFNDENIDSIQPGTYLPFGIGPRNCIGSRFAVMEIKTLAYYLLSEFYIDRCARTQDPLELKSLPQCKAVTGHAMDATNGFFVELRRRKPDRSPYKSNIFN